MPTLVSPAVIRPVTPGDLNLGRYGNVGVSSVVDTQAWNDVFEDVITSGGGLVKLPAARMQIENKLVLDDVLGVSEINGITVKGAGQNCTIFDTIDGLFEWKNLGGRGLGLRMSEFSVRMSAGGNNGDIIVAEQATGGVSRQPDVVLEQINIFPADPQVDYYNNAITVKGFFYPTVRRCYVAGLYGLDQNGVSIPKVDQHIGECGIRVDDCFGPELFHNKIWGGQRGISHVVTASPGGEGGTFHNNVCDSGIGIYVESAGSPGEPGFDYYRNHLNCTIAGLRVRRKRFGQVRNCVVYNQEGTSYRDFDFIECEGMQVTENVFFFDSPASTTRRHIAVDGNCSKFIMTDNQHLADGTAYDVDAAATDIDILDAYYDPTKNLVELAGGGAGTRVKPLRRRYVQWGLAAAQSIPNDADAAIVFSETQGANGFANVPGVAITVPNDKGIRRVRITLQVQWANNSVGVREAKLTLNNSVVDGLGHEIKEANGLTQMQVHGYVDVSDGSVIRAVVKQNSGSNLNLGSEGVWIRVEEDY